MKESFEQVTDQAAIIGIVDFFPILQKDFIGLKAVKDLKKMTYQMLDYFEREYDEHLEKYDPGKIMEWLSFVNICLKFTMFCYFLLLAISFFMWKYIMGISQNLNMVRFLKCYKL